MNNVSLSFSGHQSVFSEVKLRKGDLIKREIMSFLYKNNIGGKTTREISDGVDMSIYVTRLWLLRLMEENLVSCTSYKNTNKWFITKDENDTNR
ncbi:hypothetical protein L8O48_17625 [Enterobacter cloacae]|uniref:FaeA/PapI family transcriptional regulator n=1 Tax=Enterobacter cloacae TaxID=550 RepID=UPI0020067F42|nr:FaeA/PapI family transcriptional regulator [Enterobacter cloacae]MCK7268882.1 hypothetical protein [Enterobacter cloacae]